MWFLRPTRDVSLIKERQKAISLFMNPRNSEVTASLQNCLKNIKNITVSKIFLLYKLLPFKIKNELQTIMIVYSDYDDDDDDGNSSKQKFYSSLLCQLHILAYKSIKCT